MKSLFLLAVMLSTGQATLAGERVPELKNWRNADFITTGHFEHCAPQIRELFNKGTRLNSVKVNSTAIDEWTVLKVDSVSGEKVISSASLEIYTWVDGFRTRFKCGEVREVR